MKLKQGKCDVHSYIQYIRHIMRCIKSYLLDEQSLIALFMQRFTDSPVKNVPVLTLIRYLGRGNPDYIATRDDRKMKAQNRWTFVTLIVKVLALPNIQKCRDAIDVTIQINYA